jgi:predicted phosphodiesterase
MAGISDKDWKELIDEFDIKCHFDVLRKASQTIFGGYFVNEYLKNKGYINSPATNLSEAREILGEQYIVKQQIHNDRIKVNKVKRELVPCMSVADELAEIMRENNFKVEIPEYMYSPTIGSSKYTMVCNISDWHIGYMIENCNGNSFNWEIANERINKYIAECKKYIDLYDIKKIYVINTGDTIENSYMRDTQQQCCEFLQSMQISKATKLIYRLLVSLAENCDVIYGGIAGNHDRMNGDRKKNYEGDNANVIINEQLKDLVEVSESNKISFIDTNYNDSEIKITINGLLCKFIHGDKVPKIDRNSLAKMISCDNEFYDLLFSGHLHNFSLQSENHGRYLIQTGCLSGYNDYSKSFYCTTEASQTIAILEDSKVELIKDVILQ